MNKVTPPRPTAREELATITQDRIMEGLAALLRAGSDEVTFDLVARQSGVPQRTLYRYFANKETLLGAFWHWVNALISVPALPASPEQVVAHIPELFSAFDRDEPLVRAMLHNPHGRAVRLAHAKARREKFSIALRDVTGTIPSEDAQHLLAAVTALCSASGWESMKDNWSLSGAEAAKAAQWAVQALIDDARRLSRGPEGRQPATMEGDAR
ncbi:TetR/AcrR family transcriptional regulator [Rhizobium sp. WYCCWR 11279]|uniref:TetR/AcrR family transcriptional regulator n=1 Tax=Rhizobium changzhiense TaxID=2692317 RepID=UPI001491B941|nr:TetR/AcrR family transcriptional regulator [Rhizobium changzhiense]MCH4545968.1 TetR/AcrR family transcriptional regulator [Rhizobium changzhiense]NNU48359.1 TetR/AcrR family transcriptional regulator [Rhizobium changzhiense]